MMHTSSQDRRTSLPTTAHGTYQFPDLPHDALHAIEDSDDAASPGPGPLPSLTKLHSNDRWQARQNGSVWGNGAAIRGTRHSRQKSLSEAIRTVRTRHGSMSQNAQEIAEALRAPVSAKLVILCAVWYATSILSNASSKTILIALPRPITLTVVQFLFVSGWCLFASWIAKMSPTVRHTLPVLRYGIRKPSREIIMATLPLTAFQIGGHILNSDAMSRTSVSLVHTIKGLSPLFTVFAYRIFFDVHYSFATYASLFPLTIGVILACSASFRGEFMGIMYAFGSAILFVTQNIVSKTIFTEASRAEADGVPPKNRKPDKLNLLCYSSGMALIITFPLWLWSEGFSLFADFVQDASVELSKRPDAVDHGRLALEFIFNGTFHFSQSLVAFVLLGLVSPVTYSVASLIKRVFVIVFAIIWFGNPMTKIQGFGITLTILGLYLYDRTSDAAKQDKRMRKELDSKHALLPTINADAKRNDAEQSSVFMASPVDASPGTYAMHDPFSGANGDGRRGSTTGWMRRMSTPGSRSQERRGSNVNHQQVQSQWLPPGTKAEETWRAGDGQNSQQNHAPSTGVPVR